MSCCSLKAFFSFNKMCHYVIPSINFHILIFRNFTSTAKVISRVQALRIFIVFIYILKLYVRFLFNIYIIILLLFKLWTKQIHLTHLVSTKRKMERIIPSFFHCLFPPGYIGRSIFKTISLEHN